MEKVREIADYSKVVDGVLVVVARLGPVWVFQVRRGVAIGTEAGTIARDPR